MNVFHCQDWMFEPLIDWKGQETKYDPGVNSNDLKRNCWISPREEFIKTFVNRCSELKKKKKTFSHVLSVFEDRLCFPGLTCEMHWHVLSRHESLNALGSFSPTPCKSVWNKGVSFFYLYHAFIILHPTTDLCHGNLVSLLHCWFQSGPEGLVS